jgi:predicted CXXCH cytochrome family protein
MRLNYWKVFVLALAGLLMPAAVMAAHTTAGCDSCHTVHGASSTVTSAPLWDPNFTIIATSFTPYDSNTLDTTDIPATGAEGVSRLCMSCHDGSTAGTDMGSDLSDDHPVSFAYDSALATADGDLEDPSSKVTSLGGTIAHDLLDNDGKLQCSSCHDPHVGSIGSYYLVFANTNGALCKTCHKK